jgi:hypothetical protein
MISVLMGRDLHGLTRPDSEICPQIFYRYPPEARLPLILYLMQPDLSATCSDYRVINTRLF